MTRLRPLAALVGVVVLGCTSGGRGDSETHFLKCHTTTDCPATEVCVALRCVAAPDASADADVIAVDASVHDAGRPTDASTDGGGTPRSGDGGPDVVRDAGGADATITVDGAAPFVCGRGSTPVWGGEQPVSPLAWSDQFMSEIPFGRLGVAADGSAFAVFAGAKTGTNYDRAFVSRYSPGAGWVGEPLLGSVSTSGATLEPQIAVSDDGEAMVTWGDAASSDGGAPIVTRAMHYGNGWDAPTILAGSDARPTGLATVVADAHGNFVAAYSFQEGARFERLGVARYSAGKWTEASDTASMTGDSGGVSAVLNAIVAEPSGHALVPWSELTVSNSGVNYANPGWVRARRYVKGVGFADAEVVAHVSHLTEEGPLAAIDGDGNAVMTWTELGTDGNAHARASVFYNGVWGPPSSLDAGLPLSNSGAAQNPSIGSDRAGHFMAVFGVQNGSDQEIFASVWTRGGDWSTPVAITQGSSVAIDGGSVPLSSSAPSLAMSTDGSAVVRFSGSAPGKPTFAMGAHYSPRTGWADPVALVADFQGIFPPPVIDGCGNATLVVGDLSHAAYAIRYHAKTGWSGVERLDTGDLFIGQQMNLAVGPSGDVVTTFQILESGVPAVAARALR